MTQTVAKRETAKTHISKTIILNEDSAEPPLETVSRSKVFERLKASILEKRPVLNDLLKESGKDSLFAYMQSYFDMTTPDYYSGRRDQFIATFKRETAKLLGKEVASSAAEQLKKHYLVSTADHHGPICHPFFINSNIAMAAPYMESKDDSLKNIIVLAYANISFDNSSFPRGLMYTTFSKGTTRKHQLPFFPRSVRPCPVFGFRGYTLSDMERLYKQLDEKFRDGDLSEKDVANIRKIVDEVYGQENVLKLKYFQDQITVTNFHLWRKFFEKSDMVPPNLIYMEQAGLVNNLILDHHIDNKSTINKILFDEECHELVMKYFDKTMGGFSISEKSGTYLFWALPKGAKYRLQLWKSGRFLVSEDGTYRVELTPGAIREALKNNELIPSTLLSFVILSLYYGVKLLGGFSQINYLTKMKESYARLLKDLNENEGVDAVYGIETRQMCGDITLAYLGCPDGSITPATGLDLIIYGDKKTIPLLIEMTKKVSFEEALSPMMPELYRIVFPEPIRDKLLLDITAEEITEMLGLNKKITPFANLTLI